MMEEALSERTAQNTEREEDLSEGGGDSSGHSQNSKPRHKEDWVYYISEGRENRVCMIHKELPL